MNQVRKGIYAAPLQFSPEVVRQASEKANREVDHAWSKKGKANARNTRAWLFSTSPLKELRNGDQALRDALEACALTDWKDSSMIDTLAAAYAEKGDYAKAITTENRALSLAGQTPKLIADEHRHLTEYEHRRPYRMSAADREP